MDVSLPINSVIPYFYPEEGASYTIFFSFFTQFCMELYTYLQIIKFNFLVVLTYPLNAFAYIIRYIVKLGFLIYFWSVVANSSNVEYLIGYFLLSIGISDITMSDNTNLGRTFRKAIKQGTINQILIKPKNIVLYCYAQTFGQIGLRIILGCFSIILGLILLSNNLFSIILFILFLAQAFAIGFAFNVFEGGLALRFTEVSGIKNAMHHITRVLSGQLVPFTFFSEDVQNILSLTPISNMVFGPIRALTTNELDSKIIFYFILGLFWSVLTNYFAYKYWVNGLKKYDAAGS